MSLQTMINDFRNGVAAEGFLSRKLGPYGAIFATISVMTVTTFAYAYHPLYMPTVKDFFNTMVQGEQGQIETQVYPSSESHPQPKVAP